MLDDNISSTPTTLNNASPPSRFRPKRREQASSLRGTRRRSLAEQREGMVGPARMQRARSSLQLPAPARSPQGR
ncbi:hypothetical protein ARMGADRAFT_822221 [Armillaria gallica]|uniref:Uncharacterized protein n=1 Tax=Armillaria gallica TaxID=47427 RepID=A0A2H3CCD8_ARMGA|nr:hypothetical protein ARMGADRAFT_822221 [Armillaria gallica]